MLTGISLLFKEQEFDSIDDAKPFLIVTPAAIKMPKSTSTGLQDAIVCSREDGMFENLLFGVDANGRLSCFDELLAQR